MTTQAPTRGGAGGAVLLLLLGVAAGYLVLFAWGMEGLSYDVWGGLLVAPFILAVTTPLAMRAARGEGDPRLAVLLLTALVVKLLATWLRYVISFDVYEGSVDASFYHDHGERLAPLYRDGDFGADTGWELVGTGFVQRATGFVYAVIGPSKLGGFMVFSWLGFWGLYLLYRAFVVGVPGGDRRRYAYLVFFLPSLAFWPSSIGKEAWMTFSLGLAALGAARIAAARRGGFTLAGLGLLATGLVRPHVTLLVMAALAIAYVLRRPPRPSVLSPVAKTAGVLVLVVGSLVVVTQVEEFFKIDRLNGSSIDRVLDETNARSSRGGSRFEAPEGRNLAQFPLAVVTVLFRPFPTEAHNAQAMATALEGALLLVLFGLSYRRVAGVVRQAARSAYLWFALSYTVLFVLAFSNVANFGIIARQRVQVVPFVLVLLALPRLPAVRAGAARRIHAVPEPVG